MYSLFQFVILLLLISDLVVLWSGRILMLIRLSALQGMDLRGLSVEDIIRTCLRRMGDHV